MHICDVYCEARGLSRARLSTQIFSGGKRLQQIEEGGDIGTTKFELALQWLSDNWPDSAAWPEGITRPLAEARP